MTYNNFPALWPLRLPDNVWGRYGRQSYT